MLAVYVKHPKPWLKFYDLWFAVHYAINHNVRKKKKTTKKRKVRPEDSQAENPSKMRRTLAKFLKDCAKKNPFSGTGSRARNNILFSDSNQYVWNDPDPENNGEFKGDFGMLGLQLKPDRNGSRGHSVTYKEIKNGRIRKKVFDTPLDEVTGWFGEESATVCYGTGAKGVQWAKNMQKEAWAAQQQEQADVALLQNRPQRGQMQSMQSAVF